MHRICNNFFWKFSAIWYVASLYSIVFVILSFHQTGPLMISVKGGMDSDEENKGIVISGIREGGAAHQYSKSHAYDNTPCI